MHPKPISHLFLVIFDLQANTLVEKGDLEGARALYNEAAGIEPYCVEAIFNLGLVNLRMGDTQVCIRGGGAPRR